MIEFGGYPLLVDLRQKGRGGDVTNLFVTGARDRENVRDCENARDQVAPTSHVTYHVTSGPLGYHVTYHVTHHMIQLV